MKTLRVVRSVPYVLALGLFGVAAPSHAFFNNAETKALCLAETIVSLFAVLADHEGECPTVSGDVTIDGISGSASVVTPGGAMALTTGLTVSPVRGAFCDVNVGGTLAGYPVGQYNGYLPSTLGAMTHAWNRGRTIFKSGATVRFGGINFYDEHNIKNFWKDSKKAIFYDDGLEVITKFGYPRAKWKQTSRYDRPNGLDGRLYVDKWQITPALGCKIKLGMDVDNGGGAFDAFGTVSMYPPKKR